MKRYARWRSAITGRFVSAWYGVRHPIMTVRHLVRRRKR